MKAQIKSLWKQAHGLTIKEMGKFEAFLWGAIIGVFFFTVSIRVGCELLHIKLQAIHY